MFSASFTSEVLLKVGPPPLINSGPGSGNWNRKGRNRLLFHLLLLCCRSVNIFSLPSIPRFPNSLVPVIGLVSLLISRTAGKKGAIGLWQKKASLGKATVLVDPSFTICLLFSLAGIRCKWSIFGTFYLRLNYHMPCWLVHIVHT